MPKIKMPVKSPHVDMTPMVDLFSLLLTFFMLTTSFRPQEAAIIDTPNSISEKQGPDKNIMTLFIDSIGHVYFNVDNGKDSTTHYRKDILLAMVENYPNYNLKFTEKQIKKFTNLSSFGLALKDMGKWLDSEDPKEKEKIQKNGIPIDSADGRPSELWYWVRVSRQINPESEVAIKGAASADYKVVKKVIDILQDNKVNKFNLVTNLQKEEVSLKDVK